MLWVTEQVLGQPRLGEILAQDKNGKENWDYSLVAYHLSSPMLDHKQTNK